MKRSLLTLSISILTLSLLAQEKEKMQTNDLKIAEQLKSGNSKDVLFSFFQLGLKGLTSDNKSLTFNSTLFALKLKSNPKLLKDNLLTKENFSRNLQFNIKLNLDSSYKFKGLTGGITYAIVNQRDHQLAVFTSGHLQKKIKIDSLHTEYFQRLKEASAKLLLTKDIPVEKKKEQLAAFNYSIDYMERTGLTDSIPDFILNTFEDKGKKLALQHEELIKMRKEAYSMIDKGWLWTISANGTTDHLNQFKSGALSTVILKGNNPELDIRSTFSYVDTLVITKISQVKLSSAAGLNFALLKSETGNLIEFKPYLAYELILKNPIANEEKSVFFANADLRIRITQNLWLPFTLKYDLEKNNFLGFLNVSLNLNPLK
ncbi:hypothetical protein [Pedobacter nyackensis]|uniref:Uncharacterized protein n=1 Tax=Pedobacter nyackensis TaxID=475255 RepID=A0A1W2A0B7_9SPHI|nr:hypothetical protein [Pedobacter nyackensis]SMC54179.1 hypothetical protein SAMN04488101_101224 [Pedobacter nyackensis]